MGRGGDWCRYHGASTEMETTQYEGEDDKRRAGQLHGSINSTIAKPANVETKWTTANGQAAGCDKTAVGTARNGTRRSSDWRR